MYPLKMMTEQDQPSMFVRMLEQNWRQRKFVCIGLDPEYQRLPEVVKGSHPLAESLFIFARAIIDATADLVCAYKPNSAFYEAYGEDGLHALTRIVAYIKQEYPLLPVILDAKRADIGNTNLGYIASTFDRLGVDAITLHPYLGKEALEPFLERQEKGIILLVKTSNPGSGEFQDLPVGEEREPLYLVVARHVVQNWNRHGNCALVVGATYPEEIRRVRAVVGDLPLLIPGIGTQGGDVAATVAAAQDSQGMGMIINSSRSIIYASRDADFAQAARTATEMLNQEIQAAMR